MLNADSSMRYTACSRPAPPSACQMIRLMHTAPIFAGIAPELGHNGLLSFSLKGEHGSGKVVAKQILSRRHILPKSKEQTKPVKKSKEETSPLLPCGLPRTIPKAAVNALPLARFVGAIHLVTTPAALDLMVQTLKNKGVLGFDTESRPSFRKGENYLPSVVQFATGSDAYIVQLEHVGGLQSILPLLEDPSLLKVGVALRDDVKRLQAIEHFSPAGFTDISEMTQALGIENTGLRSLAALFLQVRISKSAQVTNWARNSLTTKQIYYAATDAWISHQLYQTTLETYRRHHG